MVIEFALFNPVAGDHSRSRVRKKWLGRKDSNLRMRIPKTRALPLGYAPIKLSRTGGGFPGSAYPLRKHSPSE